MSCRTRAGCRHARRTAFQIGSKVGVLAALSRLTYGFGPPAVGTCRPRPISVCRSFASSSRPVSWSRSSRRRIASAVSGSLGRGSLGPPRKASAPSCANEPERLRERDHVDDRRACPPRTSPGAGPRPPSQGTRAAPCRHRSRRERPREATGADGQRPDAERQADLARSTRRESSRTGVVTRDARPGAGCRRRPRTRPCSSPRCSRTMSLASSKRRVDTSEPCPLPRWTLE